MKTRFSKFLALVMAMLMTASAFAGCGGSEMPDVPADDTQSEDIGNNNEENKYPDAGKVVITDTFYPQYPEVGEYDEMKARLKKWFDEGLETGNIFSATVGEDSFDKVFSRMEKDVKRETNADGDELITATFTDAASNVQFKLEATLYGHNPSVDYVIYLSNISSDANTPLITDLYSLDSDFEMSSPTGYTIHTNEGSHESLDDFKPIVDALNRTNSQTTYGVIGGSSSYGTGFPFFDVIGKDEGIIMAIGWSGQWKSDFKWLSKDGFNMKARQEDFAAVLLPNETIRMPRIVMTYFTGDEEYGHNIWRRLVISDYTPPSDDPEGFKAPLCASTWGRTAKKIKEYLPYYKDSCVELFFIDAGWYSQGHPANEEGYALQQTAPHIWYDFLGDWSQSKILYPNGINEVTDFVHEEMNMKFMLWWMIEDARPHIQDQWTFDEKYYFMTKNADGSYNTQQALCLDEDETADMIIEYFSDYMDNQGLDAIRIDKSTSLKHHYAYKDRQREAKDGVPRVGITEAKYVVNFYRIWDTLYEKYPRFFLDNCSSGGRRIDIEMAKRGYPLWRTDKNNDNEANQAMTQYLAKWLPLNNIGNLSANDTYFNRSKYSATNIISLSTDEQTAQKSLAALEEFKLLRPYWYGDYYQLLEENRDTTVWQAYQLYREDWQKGFFVVIRRPEAKMIRQNVKLEGLMEDREYIIHNIDDEGTENDIRKTGKELMNTGIDFSQDLMSISCYTIELVRNDTDIIR